MTTKDLKKETNIKDVIEFCKVARAQGFGELANLFETYAGIQSNPENSVELEERMLRDQIKVCQNRINQLNKMR